MTSSSLPGRHQPLELGLTPSEIFEVCEGFQSCGTARESRPVDAHSVLAEQEVRNDRTGNTCRMVAQEYSDSDGEGVNEYLIELKIGEAYVWMCWSGGSRPVELAYTKSCAHQAFIKASGLIGVKVDFYPVANPSPY